MKYIWSDIFVLTSNDSLKVILDFKIIYKVVVRFVKSKF